MRTIIVSFGRHYGPLAMLYNLPIFNDGFNELLSLKDDFKTYITH